MSWLFRSASLLGFTFESVFAYTFSKMIALTQTCYQRKTLELKILHGQSRSVVLRLLRFLSTQYIYFLIMGGPE